MVLGFPPTPMHQETASSSSAAASSASSSKQKDPRKTAHPNNPHNNEIIYNEQSFTVVEGQIPEELRADLERDFTNEELEKIFIRANKRSAQPSENPGALWLFGPSAVGKSFITGAKAVAHFSALTNAVVIDGTEFREVHAGFNAVAIHGQENNLLHADAWPIFKSKALEAKQGKVTLKKRMLREALDDRQNLIIPDCANNPNRLKALIDEVRAAGYAMHAVCLWAPLSVTRSRGEERSVREGKLWTSKDYQTSTQALLTLAMRWLDGMRDEPHSFCSLELWDNTSFPAKEVGLQEFAELVGMNDVEATRHEESLLAKSVEEHAQKMALHSQAIDKVRPEVERINTSHNRRGTVFTSAPGVAAPTTAPAVGEFVRRPADAADAAELGQLGGTGGMARARRDASQRNKTASGDAPWPQTGAQRTAMKQEILWPPCSIGDRWRGRVEGLLPGLVIGLAVALSAWVTGTCS